MENIAQSELVWRLVIATALGVILGLERSLAGKHAGMRTYALVSLGSALFVIVGILSAYNLLAAFPAINPVQIAGSIVIGIGFIGAGLAALRGEHPELTTASGIWLSAGIGMGIGFGLYTVSVAAAVLGFLVFWLFAKLEHSISKTYGTKREE